MDPQHSQQEKNDLVREVLQLQNTLEDLSGRVQTVADENSS